MVVSCHACHVSFVEDGGNICHAVIFCYKIATGLDFGVWLFWFFLVARFYLLRKVDGILECHAMAIYQDYSRRW